MTGQKVFEFSSHRDGLRNEHMTQPNQLLQFHHLDPWLFFQFEHMTQIVIRVNFATYDIAMVEKCSVFSWI